MQPVFRLCRTHDDLQARFDPAHNAPSQALSHSARSTACVYPDPQPGGRAAQAHGQVVVQAAQGGSAAPQVQEQPGGGEE